jgi:ketosteroid isomerase-like protein
VNVLLNQRYNLKKFLILFFICAAIYSQQNLLELNSLVANEFAFASKAKEVGVKESFLQFIADDGILFRPGPVNGKKYLSENKSSNAYLAWYPTNAAVARTGDLGFTTGPWEYRKNKTDSTAIAFGNFCTVWRKQPDNSWKFVVDIGNDNDKPIRKPLPLKYDTTQFKNSQRLIRGAKHEKPEELLNLDREFSSIASKTSLAQTYQKYINDKTEILRDGTSPLTGSSSIVEFVSQGRFHYKFVPAGGGISSLKDFGYTFGELIIYKDEPSLGDQYNYLRIWQKDEKHWALLVEVNSKLNK